MRRYTTCILIAAAIVLSASSLLKAEHRGVTNTSASLHVKLRSVDLDDVKWTQGFWAEKFDLCQNTMIPSVHNALQNPQNATQLNNFRVAAGLQEGPHRGTNWGDGDCYKWLEAVAHVYAVTRDGELDRLMDKWIDIIGKAQSPDGYLSTNIQLTSKDRYTNPHHHEMYNMGHLMTAACIHHRATGKNSFLKIATRLADHLYKEFKPRPKRLAHFGWNPSNIMALVELYRTTREPKYLELAGIFIDMRGSTSGGTDLTQNRVPLRRETEAVGHCVCACYLYCGAADVYAETGETALRKALERIWQNAATRRMYITGAVGSFWHGKSSRGDPVHEAFGVDYQLPNRIAYCETCANIGNAMWNWRMLALAGDAKYACLMERVLYNSMLSAVGAEGKDFFYCNPQQLDNRKNALSRHHTPTRWSIHSCFCCPPQVVRTIAKLHGWAYSISGQAVWVNLYGGNILETRLPDGSPIKLTQQTNYPWDGHVKIIVDKVKNKAFAIMLRIPSWAERATIKVNGQRVSAQTKPGTYVPLRRKWSPGDVIELDLPMEVHLMKAHPAVTNLYDHVAVMRGPIVYCLELPEKLDGARTWRAGVFLLENIKLTPHFESGLLGGVVVLKGKALTREGKKHFLKSIPRIDARDEEKGWTNQLYRKLSPRQLKQPDSGTVDIALIPYYAWANRGSSYMKVWIPLAR